jgi:hypothetical protein
MSKDNFWVAAIISPFIIFIVFLSSIVVKKMIYKWEESSLEHKIEMAKLEASAAYYEKNK